MSQPFVRNPAARGAHSATLAVTFARPLACASPVLAAAFATPAVALPTSSFTTVWCPAVAVGGLQLAVAFALIDRAQAAISARRRSWAKSALAEIAFAL